jgi:capsular polysaccharide biosynthesis protein
MTKNKNLVKCICEICGKEFFWKKTVTICQEKSTCRVLKHQRKVAKEAREKQRSMMSIDAFIVYQDIVKRSPTVEPFIQAFMDKYDMEATENMLAVVYETIGRLGLET